VCKKVEVKHNMRAYMLRFINIEMLKDLCIKDQIKHRIKNMMQ
jgi:hypothetical protein